jgi:2-dehydropantoate 2-reductase
VAAAPGDGCHTAGVRFVVVGAGAIGGVVGGRLHEHGHEVVLLARGAHYEAIRARGLRLESPAGSVELDGIETADRPSGVAWRPDDVVLLAVKSQDTPAALDALAAVAPPEVTLVCLQNGVENERAALRRFPAVYGVAVMCPTAHLEPGVVRAHSSPCTGLLDLGSWPSGTDDLAERVAAALERSTFSALPRPDIARWKWAKLLMNLGNAVEAACGPQARGGPLDRRAREEGEAVLRAAGIEFASPEEDRERRGDLLRLQPAAGHRRGGGSSWQSLARGAGSVETDYLNGEIVLLGRLHGVATPVNEALQLLLRRMAANGTRPGSVAEDEVVPVR